MIAIIDYGVGNLFSLKSSFSYIGKDVLVTGDPEKISDCDRIILPGVGAFGDAAKKLEQTRLNEILEQEAEKGTPILGICLGMQLLFDKSYEHGEYKGLGLIKGNVRPIADVIPKYYKIPHIGWNSLKLAKTKSPIYKYTNDGDFVYFVHSFYAADCAESVSAETEYGAMLTASVQNRNVFGTQFHPEKSGETGLKILRAFCEI
ncbi:imidazole glycerol phosphate synthase subunit HisH [Clostridiales bacterium]|nr:imidazole glycerol phosphate synthase subunit HisH [Clostridiales bacterium]